jgi:hypothetical protein
LCEINKDKEEESKRKVCVLWGKVFCEREKDEEKEGRNPWHNYNESKINRREESQRINMEKLPTRKKRKIGEPMLQT